MSPCFRAGGRSLFSQAMEMALVILSLSAAAANAHPVVPGFSRFYTADKADPASGGRLLLEELNCTSCHPAEGAAAALIDNKQAPVLDELATRVKPSYLREYLANPAAAKPGTTMPQVFAGLDEKLKNEQIEALVHFLMSPSPAGPPQAYAGIGGRQRGEQLYHSVGRAVCHGARKEGAAALANDKPLGQLDKKYTLPSLASFLQDPLHVRPSGRMPSLNLSSIEARDIAAFLLPGVPEKTGIAYKYYEGSWDRLPDFDKLQPKAIGGVERIDISAKKRDDNFGLRFDGALPIDVEGDYTFHIGSDDGSRLKIDGKVVVDNDGIHGMQFKSGKVKLAKGIHHVQVEVFEKSGGEELVADFEGPGIKRQKLHAAIVAAQPEKPIEPLAFTVDPALAEKGRQLFASAGCASCHQLREKGDTAIASKPAAMPLAALKGSGGCLSESVPKGLPDFAISAAQRTALKAAVESLKKPAARTPKQQIATTMARLNCYACHQRDGIGGVEQERNAWFQGTQPEMGDEGRLPPPLDGVGGKLTAQWLAHILADGANDRPYMLTRMPKFGADNAGHLQKLMEQSDKLEPLPRVAINKNEAELAGWKMVGDKGFSCIKCHTFGRFQATGVQSIDMTVMHKRLREEWFRRYVDNPLAFRNGTRMPDAWPSDNGKSLLPDVLDGQNASQIQAVWMYLENGVRARTPQGLISDSMELIPTYEAVIYRNFIQDAGPRAIGVGYPELTSLAFDANGMRIALLWQGAFIDASKHWSGRGQGFQGPAGQNVLKLPDGPSLAVLESDAAPWPGGSELRDNGYHFRGYRLSNDRRPTFLYDCHDAHVEDFPNPVEVGLKNIVRRTFRISADKPMDNLYLRAAAGSQIEPGDDGWYVVDGTWKVRLPGAKPVVRESGGKKELLMPVKFNGKTAELIQEYDW